MLRHPARRGLHAAAQRPRCRRSAASARTSRRGCCAASWGAPGGPAERGAPASTDWSVLKQDMIVFPQHQSLTASSQNGSSTQASTVQGRIRLLQYDDAQLHCRCTASSELSNVPCRGHHQTLGSARGCLRSRCSVAQMWAVVPGWESACLALQKSQPLPGCCHHLQMGSQLSCSIHCLMAKQAASRFWR